MESRAFRGALDRRQDLYSAVADLDAAVTAAGDGAGWFEGVERALVGLEKSYADHVAEVESPSGLYREVVEIAPRLAHAVDVLLAEHRQIDTALPELRRIVEAASEGNASALDVKAEALDLLGVFARHRHRGAELYYDAYETDLGGG